MPLTRPHHPKAWLALLLALGSASAGLFLAWHYPIAWPLALLLWLGLAGLAFARWQVLPLLLPALVPLVGFAPWSGWLSFEELDLLVLAVATGGYLVLALGGRDSERAPVWQRSLGWSGLTKVLLALFAASVLLAIWRGGMQAGGWRFGWWQGYHEPMNSLRQGKSLFLLLLLLPLWRAAAARQPLAAPQRLALALQLALAGAALAAVWERLAFTGLLNFSTDYRTTALFWETHVGGAPLDACLALTFPFALAGLLQEQRPRRFIALLALLLLGGYAALATFSRGVYLAVPLGGALCLALLAWQRRGAAGTWRDGGAPAHWPRRAVLLALLLGFGLAAWPLFLGGGYRALLALAGSALLLIAMPPLRLQTGRSQRLIVLMLAAMLAAMAAALFWVLSLRIPKAAYVLDGLVVLGGLGLAWWWRAGLTRHLQACVLAAAVFLSLACAAVVAGHWGGEGALLRAWPTLALLALAWGGLQLLPGSAGAALVTLSWRDRGLLWTGCVLLCGVIATFAGGSYMGDRMETGRHDLEQRLAHWRLGLSLLDGPEEWLLGKGTGRFVDSYFYAGPEAERVGDYRLHEDAPAPYLSLSSGRHMLGWGEVFRISQRVDVPQGMVRLKARMRSADDVGILAEVCEKHLIYNNACVANGLELKGRPGQWQDVELEMGMAPPAMGGRWWSPRLIAFSIALGSGAERVDIAALQLSDARGDALLANGDFSRGLARWFSSSDRNHMPWHMKSLPLHLLFEQGLVGLALGGTLLVAALWRCTLGHARRHPLAPAVAGALLGFLVVGLFDSLIDAPRIGFLFFAVLALGLGLRALPKPKA